MANLTQGQLAEKLGVSQKHLSILETGNQFASASLIERLCKELRNQKEPCNDYEYDCE